MDIVTRTAGEVGAAIRARRRALGWDQATLAGKVNVSRLWIGQVEGGKPGASLGLVLRAFAALDLKLTVAASDSDVQLHEAIAPVESADIAAILDAARGKPAP